MVVSNDESSAVPAGGAGPDPAGPDPMVPGPAIGVPPPGRRRSRRGCLAGAAIAVVVLVVLAGGAALLIKRYVGQAYFIPTESMSPTLEVGDRVLVDKTVDRSHLGRGDIVVFEVPGNAGRLAVKRVVALPGESVTIDRGRLGVDGAPLAEPWLAAGTTTAPADRRGAYAHHCSTADPCVVPAGQVWVMGDNRPSSEDSRYFGPVDDTLVVGRATEIIWPRTRAGSV